MWTWDNRFRGSARATIGFVAERAELVLRVFPQVTGLPPHALSCVMMHVDVGQSVSWQRVAERAELVLRVFPQ